MAQDSSLNHEWKRTVLGSPRENPFAIVTMNLAFHNIYGRDTNFSASHLYVKFIPLNLDEFNLLQKSELSLFDYPLHYKLVEENQYYFEETETQVFPELWTVVPADETLPSVGYSILEYMNLNSNDAIVMKEAARLTGNLDDLPSIVLKKEQTQQEGGSGGNDGGGSGGGGSTNNITCGCGSTNSRFPSGCVTVWDSEYGSMVPVVDVTVQVRDNWFTWRWTSTNNIGCWVINYEHFGKAWVKILFKNTKCFLRGVHGNTKQKSILWSWGLNHPLPEVNGPNFNNINVAYPIWSAVGSFEHIRWSAATTINAVNEFHSAAIIDGINNLGGTQLDFFIANRSSTIVNTGFTTMKNFLTYPLLTTAYAAGLAGRGINTIVGMNSIPLLGLLSLAAPNVAAPMFATVAFVISTYAIYSPDIMVTNGFKNSDQFKNLIWHEMTHANHAKQVGKLWWSELIALEIWHNDENGLPYGDGSFNDAGMVALTESFAEYISHRFCQRFYPNRANNSVPDLWDDENEDLTITSGFIPEGLHYDLQDLANAGNNNNEPIINGTRVDDDVNGLTPYQIMNAMGVYPNGVRVFGDFKANIMNSRGSNTVNQMNALFGSYGR